MPDPTDQWRLDTPACATQHFLDNAGSALSPQVVLDRTIDYLKFEQQVGGYAAAELRAGELQQVRNSIGQLVNCSPDQVALQVSATEAWRRAISCVAFSDGDRVLISSAEYASNVIPLLQIAKSVELSIETIPDGSDGTADPTALAEMMDHRVRAVAITHAPSQNGLVVDAVGIGEAITSSGYRPWYLLDACQSIGQLPVDMAAIGADFVTATGRKWLRGPRGTGFLAVSRRVLDQGLEPHPIDMFGALWDGAFGYQTASDATRFQSYEMSYAGFIGLGAAVDYTLDIGMSTVRERINSTASRLRSMLEELPGLLIVDRGTTKSGIVVFSLPLSSPPTTIAQLLRRQGITVTPIGPATNPTDVSRNPSPCTLRASPHIYNNEDDLAALVTAVRELLAQAQSPTSTSGTG